MADLASVVYKLWDEVILLGNKKLILQGNQVFGYVQNLSKEIKENFDFTYDQQLAINNVIYQLLAICTEINKINNPLLGTLKTFEEMIERANAKEKDSEDKYHQGYEEGYEEGKSDAEK